MRPVDADALARRMCELCNQYCPNDPCEPRDCVFVQAVKEAPTLTPQNEVEYREYICPNCYHTWQEDRDASDYPNYCPGCGETLNRRPPER